MTTETAKSLQNMIWTLDNEASDLAVDEYMKLMEELKQILETRIKILLPEVENKMADIKK